MKKIRDLIYDYNDIFFAIIIIAIAALILFWRVATVMDYTGPGIQPISDTEVDFTDVDLTKKDVQDYNTNPDDVTTSGGAVSQENQQSQGQNQTEQKPAAKDVEFTIASGEYGSTVAKNLVSKGLIAKESDFTDALSKLNAESKIQLGTFKIPAGSTAEDIVKIVCRLKN